VIATIVTPPAASWIACRSSGLHTRSMRASRATSDESTSGSVPPAATCSSSSFSEACRFRSRGSVSLRSLSVTPTQSTMTKWVFAVASGDTWVSSVGATTRTPRPFICSKRTRLCTERMNQTISTGRMSVPVAIMSTVTAMRG